jgi:crossover junction endodeoxyribonuclease RuvC
MASISRILGLDPGLRHAGWGIIDSTNQRLVHVAHGVIHSDATLALSSRLQQIYQGLQQIIEQYAPDEAAVEETFVNVNAAATLKLGMARGVVLLVPAMHGFSVGEYSANKVKKSVVGVGHANKTQVAAMVQRLLPTAGPVSADAADALAVAICHAHHLHLTRRWVAL